MFDLSYTLGDLLLWHVTPWLVIWFCSEVAYSCLAQGRPLRSLMQWEWRALFLDAWRFHLGFLVSSLVITGVRTSPGEEAYPRFRK